MSSLHNIFEEGNIRTKSYPKFSNVCSEAVVDGDYKIWIFLQYSFLIATLRGYLNQHCEEPRCSLQTLERKSPIVYYAALFDLVTFTFS